MNDWFHRFASRAAEVAGRSYAFIVAVTVLAIWASTGPLFHFSDTWQLVVNTATTIVTFLMVFLIQNTQNRDAHAIHLKLERAHSRERGRAQLRLPLALESMSDDDLLALQGEFEGLRDRRPKARGSPLRRDLAERAAVVEAGDEIGAGGCTGHTRKSRLQ